MAFRVHTIFIVHKTVIVYTFSFDLRRTHRRLGTNGQACCATEPKRERLGCPLFSCWIWVKKMHGGIGVLIQWQRVGTEVCTV